MVSSKAKTVSIVFRAELARGRAGRVIRQKREPRHVFTRDGVQAPYVRSHSVDCTAACVCWPVPRSDYFPGDPWSQKGTNSLFGCCEVPTE